MNKRMWLEIGLKDAAVVAVFLVAYCVQPLLVDVIKFNGGAHVGLTGAKGKNTSRSRQNET